MDTTKPHMRVRVTLPTEIVAQLNELAHSDHRTFDQIVAAAILALAETRSYERDVFYHRTGSGKEEEQ